MADEKVFAIAVCAVVSNNGQTREKIADQGLAVFSMDDPRAEQIISLIEKLLPQGELPSITHFLDTRKCHLAIRKSAMIVWPRETAA